MNTAPELSIEDQLTQERDCHYFVVLHNGKPRFLPHHEAYDLVLLALNILNNPAVCDAIIKQGGIV
jgi:hypothetical protein